MSTNVLVKSLAILGVAILCSPAAHATTITVQNLGSILNDSVSFPNTKTPGVGKTFDDFFEFTLPTAEYISASMSISGPVVDQIPAGKGAVEPIYLDVDFDLRAIHPIGNPHRASHGLRPILRRPDGGRRFVLSVWGL